MRINSLNADCASCPFKRQMHMKESEYIEKMDNVDRVRICSFERDLIGERISSTNTATQLNNSTIIVKLVSMYHRRSL
jgi:hypothetical protein